jgi:competence protein ComEC
LWSRKILTVDILVLTHPNSDHLNGLLYIADRFHVGEIWTNGERVRTGGYRNLMRIARRRKIRRPIYQALPGVLKIGAVTVSRLYPPKDFQSRKRTETWRNVNNNSVVLRISMDGIGFLFAGDLMRRAETELVAMAGDKLKSAVLFVPHHGSNSSSAAPFLRTVDPALAIVSAGPGNRFGFPHKQVLKRYQAIGCRVYRTDRHGAISLTTRRGRLEIETTVDGKRATFFPKT